MKRREEREIIVCAARDHQVGEGGPVVVPVPEPVPVPGLPGHWTSTAVVCGVSRGVWVLVGGKGNADRSGWAPAHTTPPASSCQERGTRTGTAGYSCRYMRAAARAQALAGASSAATVHKQLTAAQHSAIMAHDAA